MHNQPEIEKVMEKLDLLSGDNQRDSYSNPQMALQRFQQSIQPKQPTRKFNMTTKRLSWAVAMLILPLVILLSVMPSSRAWASDLLSIFRVSKFAPISVSPQQLAFLDAVMSEGDALFPGELTFSEDEGESQTFDNLSDAFNAYISEFDGGSFETIDGYGTPTIYIEDGGEATLTVNLDAARRLLELAEIDPLLLPDSLDGQDITASVDTVIVQEFDDIELIQTFSPEINYPDGVDVRPIGEAVLRMMGMNESDALRLSHNIDWTNTLVLPIPTEFMSFSEVALKGTTGLALQPIDGEGITLIWENYGSVFMLHSNSAEINEVLDIVDSMYYYWE